MNWKTLFQIDRSNWHILFWLSLGPLWHLYNWESFFPYYISVKEFWISLVLIPAFLIFPLFWYFNWLYQFQKQLATVFRFEQLFLRIWLGFTCFKFLAFKLDHLDSVLLSISADSGDDAAYIRYRMVEEFLKYFRLFFQAGDLLFMAFSALGIAWFVYRCWTVSRMVQDKEIKNPIRYNFLFLYFLVFPVGFYGLKKLKANQRQDFKID